MREKIKSFTDLRVWQEGFSLAISVYKVTNKFPREERFCLIDQIRRAAISITSNIAEGFSRRTKKEKIQFYYMALGSLTEPQNQLLLARGLGYINPEDFKTLADKAISVQKLLHFLIKGVENLSFLP